MPEGLLVPLPGGLFVPLLEGLFVPLLEGLLVLPKGFLVDSFLDILGVFVFLDGAFESVGALDTLGPSEGSEDGIMEIDGALDTLGPSEGREDGTIEFDGALESDGALDTLGPSEGIEDGTVDNDGVFEGDVDSEGLVDGERLGALLSSEVIRMVTVSVEEFPHSSVTVSVATVSPTDD